MLAITRTASEYAIAVQIESKAEKRDQFRVAQTLRVELFDGRIVAIPAGFVTDCHSTPPWTQSLLPAYDTRTALAAIVHDYLYMHWERYESEAGILELHRDLMGRERRYADRCYLDLMERFAPGYWRNQIYYTAVRLFGGWNWSAYRKQAK
ncbi:DUF1353 domain-containing protein [Fibrivirga algicola]|uniref:DUF1353 domain-containing protein n=1 Tax=Fibrivirga algicola TaxID=2950420 RepID=A0ABX0QBE6_9BACT|nr:DUF1353 domain-containing protein [Fibrivirga algicola]NID09376.1 DUF1353 domain-containing protein [Fibrivirga algicola]